VGTCIIRCGRRLMLTTSLLDCSVWSAGMGAPTQQRILRILCVAVSEDIKTLPIALLLLYNTSAACQKDFHVHVYDTAAIVELRA